MKARKPPAAPVVKVSHDKRPAYLAGTTAPLFSALFPEAMALAALVPHRGRGVRYSMGRCPSADPIAGR